MNNTHHSLTAHVFSSCGLAVVILGGSCTDSDHVSVVPNGASKAAHNAVMVSTGTGIYIGERLVLTNSHVCQAVEGLQFFSDSDRSGNFHYEGPPLEAWECSPELMTACKPHLVARVFSKRENYDSLGLVTFADSTIDLCILELKPSPQPPSDFIPIRIQTALVRVGQEVVASGYPLGKQQLTTERCAVTKGTELVADPDPIYPSGSRLMSFGISCKSIQHGSSGSPVFDAISGELLGLAWTRECPEAMAGSCSGTVYVTAASEWQHAANADERKSRLRDLLQGHAE